LGALSTCGGCSQTAPALAGFLIAFMSAGLFEDTGRLNLSLKTTDCTVEGLAIANFY